MGQTFDRIHAGLREILRACRKVNLPSPDVPVVPTNTLDSNEGVRITVRGLLSYPNLSRPVSAYNGGLPKYKAQIIPDKSELLGIHMAISRISLAKWGDEASISIPLRRKEDWRLYVSNSEQPILRGMEGMPERPDYFYAGQSVEADVRFWSYDVAGRRGVAATLLGVKLLGGFVRSTQ